MKRIAVLLIISFNSFCQDEVKKPITDFFRIVSAASKTLDDSELSKVLASNHTFVNDLKMQSVYDYTKYLINESVNTTVLSQVNKFAHVQISGQNAYVIVLGTDKYRVKNTNGSQRFIASFLLGFDDKSKSWLITNIHMTNEKR